MEFLKEIRPELLSKAFIFHKDICWKLKDIKEGITEITKLKRKIEAITIYFKVGEKVYCPTWGDFLQLENNNDFLKLFEGINTSLPITIELLAIFAERFGLCHASFKTKEIEQSIKEEIALKEEAFRLNIQDLYFAITLE